MKTIHGVWVKHKNKIYDIDNIYFGLRIRQYEKDQSWWGSTTTGVLFDTAKGDVVLVCTGTSDNIENFRMMQFNEKKGDEDGQRVSF